MNNDKFIIKYLSKSFLYYYNNVIKLIKVVNIN